MYIKYDSVQVYSGFSLCVIHDANGTLIGLCAQATQRAFVVKYCQKSIVKILCQLCNSNLIKYFLFCLIRQKTSCICIHISDFLLFLK